MWKDSEGVEDGLGGGGGTVFSIRLPYMRREARARGEVCLSGMPVGPSAHVFSQPPPQSDGAAVRGPVSFRAGHGSFLLFERFGPFGAHPGYEIPWFSGDRENLGTSCRERAVARLLLRRHRLHHAGAHAHIQEKEAGLQPDGDDCRGTFGGDRNTGFK